MKNLYEAILKDRWLKLLVMCADVHKQMLQLGCIHSIDTLNPFHTVAQHGLTGTVHLFPSSVLQHLNSLCFLKSAKCTNIGSFGFLKNMIHLYMKHKIL